MGQGTATIASGATPQPILPGTWHTLQLTAKASSSIVGQSIVTFQLVQGSTITAMLDGVALRGGTFNSNAATYGQAAIGSGLHPAWFDNLVIAKA